MTIIKHFTATTFVTHGKRVLLHLHKKIGLWLPVGGHLEDNELPEDAALREVKEETGLDVKLIHSDGAIDFVDARQLFRPEYILLEDIGENHQHIDLIYFATTATDLLSPDAGETSNLKWFTIEEIETLQAPKNVKILAKKALAKANFTS